MSAEPNDPHPASFVDEGEVDVAVVVVTYRNQDEVPALLASLRAEAAATRLRVVVADNSPDDDTMAALALHPDVLSFRTGGNLGYAAGVNAAMEHARDAPAVLILNPDLRVAPGAIAALLASTGRHPRAGVIAPRIVDDDGALTPSIFHEPGVLRAWCDALLGPVWASRPAALTEWVRSPDAYGTARRADWVSGAAMLLTREAIAAVGEWDERFFLYSEETDYCRRVRDAGFDVWLDPAATVAHSQGKSGSSPALAALQAVNRVRYVHKHAPARAGAFRWGVLVGEAMRAARSPRHRAALSAVRQPRRWSLLPHATWSGSAEPAPPTVVIPAHDEEAVIGRTLTPLQGPVRAGALSVIVACNGCSDRTAQIAASFDAVRVLDLPVPSKVAALNAADGIAGGWPRIYLDADVMLPPAAIPGLLRALRAPGVHAARPAFVYDVSHSTPLVRAYYRARFRIPAMSSALWGAGIYAVDEEGHARIAPFPPLVADDLHVENAFPAAQKAFPPTPPVVVHPPRTTRALRAVIARARRGADEQGVDDSAQTARALLRTVHGPGSFVDAVVFAAVTVAARRRGRAPSSPRWERDETSRRLQG